MPNDTVLKANSVTSWIDQAQGYSTIAQAVFAFIAVVAGIIGFVFVLRQIKQVERSIRGETLQSLFSQWGDVARLLFDHSEFHPFFYDNVEVPAQVDEKTTAFVRQVSVLTEMFADVFENVTFQKENMPPEIYETWGNFFRYIYSNSPNLRKFYVTRSNEYGPEMKRLIKKAADGNA